MPNWVFNSVVVSGDAVSLEALRNQLNQPVTKHFPDGAFNKETSKWEYTPATQHYSAPIFSFWNVVAPTNLEAYYGSDTREKSQAFGSDGSFNGDTFMSEFNDNLENNPNWYWWNLKHWGTKWDVCASDDEKYSDTRLEINDEDGSLIYYFQTAWSPVFEIFDILAEQYPTLTFQYEYEEEQGWGGGWTWNEGQVIESFEYDIPDSHADFLAHPYRECYCQTGEEEEYWFSDCPRESVLPDLQMSDTSATID